MACVSVPPEGTAALVPTASPSPKATAVDYLPLPTAAVSTDPSSAPLVVVQSSTDAVTALPVPSKVRGAGWCYEERMAALEGAAKVGRDPTVGNGQKGAVYESRTYHAFINSLRTPPKEAWERGSPAELGTWYGRKPALVAKQVRDLRRDLGAFHAVRTRVDGLQFTGNPSEERLFLATSYAIRIGRVIRAEMDQIVYCHPQAPSVTMWKKLPLYISVLGNPTLTKLIESSENAVMHLGRNTNGVASSEAVSGRP